MHATQESILALLQEEGVIPLHYSRIGRKIGVKHVQNVKHHLQQLQKRGLLHIDSRRKIIKVQEDDSRSSFSLTRIPILGSANCGQALAIAEENCEGYLKVSESIVPSQKSYFAVRAKGTSLNKADINGKSIEDDDYVIIDPENKAPTDGEYILSIIDGCANIKRFSTDVENGYIVLLSKSTEEIEPIIIDQNDDYHIAGVVDHVVKKPQVNL